MPRLTIAEDARDQVRTLLFSVGLAVALSFVPYANWLLYPFRLFVTFIHEGGHAVAALATGNSVESLSIATDGSGEVLATHDSLLSGLFISSAGYLGATLYGAALLVLIRRQVAARLILIATAVFIGLMSLRFGWSNPFTLASGVVLAGVLLLAARHAQERIANFLLSFVAVQCVLNALFDLRTLLNLSSPMEAQVHTDALNMAQATGIPAIVWALLWIGLSLALLRLALRSYIAAPAPTASAPST